MWGGIGQSYVRRRGSAFAHLRNTSPASFQPLPDLISSHWASRLHGCSPGHCCESYKYLLLEKMVNRGRSGGCRRCKDRKLKVSQLPGLSIFWAETNMKVRWIAPHVQQMPKNRCTMPWVSNSLGSCVSERKLRNWDWSQLGFVW